MIQSSQVPEFILEEKLAKTLLSIPPLKATKLTLLVEVEAELRLLSKELTMSVDILGKIRDSVHVLELSLEDSL